MKKISERDDTIKELQSSINVKNEVTKNLNKKLTESNAKARKEKAAIVKDYKAEIKSWRKDLVEERKQKLKLEKKIEELSIEETTNLLIMMKHFLTRIPFCLSLKTITGSVRITRRLMLDAYILHSALSGSLYLLRPLPCPSCRTRTPSITSI